MDKQGSSLKKRLNMLLAVSIVPLAIMSIYLLVSMNRFSERYDKIVEKITIANSYSINFKEDMDYLMYIIVVNSERADELIDTQKPHQMIIDARKVFQSLYDDATTDYAKNCLEGILKSLNILDDRIVEIEEDAKRSGSYDKNMERLELNIRILTELIQEQIQKYIYYETSKLEALRVGIRSDVEQAIEISIIVFVGTLMGVIFISNRIMISITKPIQKLCEMTKLAGRGNFAVRAQEDSTDELSVLNASFNEMVEEIGNLVEDIRVEQLNLRAMELKLMQAQINPHFLYNTLDAIIWLAESNQNQEVVAMVSSLSNFFRTTLSKGKDYISIREEESHIQSYLEIQQFRYRDILAYEIQIPEKLYQYQILKLSLQPLVENALYHGIKNKRGLGHIFVSGEEQNGNLIFKVKDNGIGMTKERLLEVRSLILGEVEDSKPSGFGLFNVQQRTRLNYGYDYGLEIESQYGEGTEIKLTIPAVKK